MNRRWARGAVETLLAGWVFCGAYAATGSLSTYGLVHLPLWVTVAINLAVGVFLSLLAIDLRRMLAEVVGASVLAAILYWAVVASPSAAVPAFFNNLGGYGLTQTVAVFFLALFPGLIGAMIGTVINTSARGYEL